MHGTNFLGAKDVVDAGAAVEAGLDGCDPMSRAESKHGALPHSPRGGKDELDFVKDSLLRSSKRCFLTCFLPDGSPIQGQTVPI